MEIEISDFLSNPWRYINIDKEVFIIGISGGSASGKTFIAEKIAEFLNCKILAMDDYFLDCREYKNENWDLPEACDLDLLKRHLIELKKGNPVEKPIHNFCNGFREGFEEFCPDKIIILEGNFALYEKFLDLIDFGIFVHSPEKIRFNRRLIRDINDRNRTEEEVFEWWENFIQPAYIEFIEPQKEKADLIIIN